MPKLAPDCHFAVPTIADAANRLEYSCEVVTPMLGGGAKPRTPHNPESGFRIRPPSIRGHLRFWWRTVCGARHAASPSQLRAVESELWGATSRASRIRLRVTIDDAGRNLTQKEIQGLPSPIVPIYPIQAVDRPNVVVGMKFTVLIVVSPKPGATQVDPNEMRDLRRAAFAWTVLGGIGSRTRRGMGALLCTDFAHPNYQLTLRTPPAGDTAPIFSLPLWPDLCATGSRPWPHLLSSDLDLPLIAAPRAGANSTPLDAMNEIIDDLRDYRMAGACSEFTSHDRTYRWPSPIRRWPSCLLLRPIRIEKRWYKMAAPLQLDTPVRDASGRDFKAGLKHGLDYFWRTLGYE